MTTRGKILTVLIVLLVGFICYAIYFLNKYDPARDDWSMVPVSARR